MKRIALLRDRFANRSDRGATQFLELGVISMLAAMIITAVAAVDPGGRFNDIVREMVCLVEGPECDGKTWTEVDRPKKPEEYSFGIPTGGRAGDNKANKKIGKELAAERGFTGREWECLETLWSHESGWNHKAVNPSSGAAGIPQLLPSVHNVPAGFMDSPEIQIEWGLNYIEDRYNTPCEAWAFWQNPTNSPSGASANWY
ncbi:transglycosylase SLT domain-containing protein [Nocardiopsis sp. RSe5-2]|uniref:Transglycosylase SLT domain-containing protein n=1 Tax=Nocardiopsis endophytica TaxID=3018445 RepID=A0ABT4U372_9ACTN|nr:transglycosylase SLT domain-containing protein [Nocardiopsis endophytica]MDA2811146.1 transglycosylase SLT domain-containing protein [Nocardiopsis endophytica]